MKMRQNEFMAEVERRGRELYDSAMKSKIAEPYGHDGAIARLTKEIAANSILLEHVIDKLGLAPLDTEKN